MHSPSNLMGAEPLSETSAKSFALMLQYVGDSPGTGMVLKWAGGTSSFQMRYPFFLLSEGKQKEKRSTCISLARVTPFQPRGARPATTSISCVKMFGMFVVKSS